MTILQQQLLRGALDAAAEEEADVSDAWRRIINACLPKQYQACPDMSAFIELGTTKIAKQSDRITYWDKELKEYGSFLDSVCNNT